MRRNSGILLCKMQKTESDDDQQEREEDWRNYCTLLDTITYEGSLEEWKAIEKYANWDGNSSTSPGYLNNIVCVDGTMAYDRDNKTWNEVKS